MIQQKDKDHSETSFSLIEADKQFRSMKETWRQHSLFQLAPSRGDAGFD
jgi:hypothetical protein